MTESSPIKVNAIIHGCPSGQQSNATRNDSLEFRTYTDRFHTGDDRYVGSPSKPGEKFIKEILPSGTLAYTFVHTGVHETRSDRPGSNYAAITLFFSNNAQVRNEKEFQQKLKQWFETNIINVFTSAQLNGWRKWNVDAEKYLFGGRQDAQIAQSLKWVFTHLATPERKDSLNIDGLDVATKKLQDEIQKLEQEEKRIQQELAQKYAELGNLTNQGKK